ncbi:hypothetical protein [Chitinophaga sp. LS1]|uniref:hypothetical protein n=1 Tax=Chitinophaga sp. LS1 TaxID=3051176 RepID=UPI002AAC2BF3|nr:hypothetical protein [Chitinophaga sp. LS1]WPV65351.1 hypothetical protein QQL36_26475 [Chitinophaga sp. LS1]
MKKSTISVALVLLLFSNAQPKHPSSSYWLKIDPKGQVWQSNDGINWTTSTAQAIYRLSDGSMLWKQDI